MVCKYDDIRSKGLKGTLVSIETGSTAAHLNHFPKMNDQLKMESVTYKLSSSYFQEDSLSNMKTSLFSVVSGVLQQS